MRKYTDAPKDIADVIKNGPIVSKEVAFGDDWKKLPYGPASQSQARKKRPSLLSKKLTISAQTVYQNPVRKGKVDFFQRVKIGDVCLEVPGTAGEAYTKALIDHLKSYLKAHPVKS
jgi:hypothetical protein